MLNLYFATFTDEDGTNWDCHLRAISPSMAKEYWRHWYASAALCLNDSEPLTDEVPYPDQLFQINPFAKAGPIGWHNPNCQEVT